MIIRNDSSTILKLGFIRQGLILAVGESATVSEDLVENASFKSLENSGVLTIVSYDTDDTRYVVKQELSSYIPPLVDVPLIKQTVAPVAELGKAKLYYLGDHVYGILEDGSVFKLDGGGNTPLFFSYRVVEPSITDRPVYETTGSIEQVLLAHDANLVRVVVQLSAALTSGDLTLNMKVGGITQVTTPAITLAIGEQSSSVVLTTPITCSQDDLISVSYDATAIQTGLDLFVIAYFMEI